MNTMRVLSAFVFYVILIITLILPGCTVQENNFPQGAITKFEILEKEFKQPAKEYGTIPFFVWNGDITREGIDEKMQDFKNAGCGGVIVHPRPGLITEYLSDKWFGLFRYAVDKGKELGLNVWIYDENSYPSGFAGGHVPALMPESYNQGQGLSPRDTTAIPSDFSNYFIILKDENGKYIDVTASAQNEVGKTGNYTLISKTYYRKSGWFGGFSYVDLLYPGVTEKFLDVTMPGYQKAAGDEFGKTVQGVFTDEPEISSPGGIRWTPDLFDVFQKQWGYDLKIALPSLWKEVGEWKKVRQNYTQTLLKLFTERWSKPTSEYYAKNGLKYTGHYWEHGWPSMRLGGDNMAMYAYHDVPAIDMLFNQFDEKSNVAQFGNIRSVKELASVANQFGRHRTLSETYGGSGWEVTFKDLKRLGDWEYVLGVNTMNQHLSFYTMAGARKYDYPPSFSYHNPWWKSYKYLNDYYARLSLALSSGKQENNILIVEPTTTAWLYDSYIGREQNPTFNEIGKSFQQFVTTLEKKQVEYDLGSEDIMRLHGKAGNSGLTVGQRTYTSVVIPPLTETLNEATFQLIKQYVAGGGTLLLFSCPTLLNGAQSQEAADFFKQQNANIIHLDKLDARIIDSYFKCSDLKFEDLKGGNLYHHRRIMEDGQIIFLANSSMDSTSIGSLIVKGNDAVLLNLFNGKIADCKEEKAGKDIKVTFSLPPAESMLLYVSAKKLKGYVQQEKANEVNLVTANSAINVKRDNLNVLPIDFCDLQLAGKSLKDVHVGEASQMVYKQNGFPDGDPWNHSVQYKTSVADRSGFDGKSGFIATYRFNLDGLFDYSAIKAVVERPELWSVSINGHPVEANSGEWWLDHSFGVFTIGQWLQKGENILSVNCKIFKVNAEIEPVYLLGDFSVVPANKGWKITAPPAKLLVGSWKEQGQPFYSWDVTYSKEYEVAKKASYYEVALGKWCGTVAEVFVNGEKAGTIALSSDKIDVTGLITEGKNNVEVKITGSLKNLLGPHHNNPAPGMTGPGHWRNIKQYPAGKDYQLLDYGLTDDFYLNCN
jgi:hypothetical protein